VESSGIVAMVQPQWAANVPEALSSPTSVITQNVDAHSAQQVKDAVANSTPPPVTK